MPVKVSVVIPAHNAGPYIQATIDSVYRQALKDWEIIVVNDGSTDNTAAVVETALSDPRIHLIHEKGLGPGGAKNAGARIATGDYLAFLDADDELADNALEIFFDKLEETGASWVICDIEKKSPTGSVIRQAELPEAKANDFHTILRKDFVTRGIFFRRSAFLAVGMYDASFRIREDWEIHIRMFESGQPYVYLPQPLYIYWDRSGSITKQKNEALECTERLLHKHQKRLANQGSKVYAEIYAEDMWELAKWYFQATRDVTSMLRCLRESLRYDFNLARLFHPLIFRFERLFRSASAGKRE